MSFYFKLALNRLPQTLLLIGIYLKRWYQYEQGGIKAQVIRIPAIATGHAAYGVAHLNYRGVGHDGS